MVHEVAYHYTTFEAWKSIQKKGLIPQPLRNRQVMKVLADEGLVKPSVTWLWSTLTVREHIGNIIQRLADHDSTKIVWLQVEYTPRQVYQPEGFNVKVTHEGNVGKFNYHHLTKSVLLDKTVKPKYIKLIKLYDLEKLLI